MKPTVASLQAMVTTLQGQVKSIQVVVDKLEKCRKAAAITYLKNQTKYSTEAQQKIQASMARRAALRAKIVNNEQVH